MIDYARQKNKNWFYRRYWLPWAWKQCRQFFKRAAGMIAAFFSFRRSSLVCLQMGKTPLKEVSWFKECGRMAIADKCYVVGLGECTHQPGRAYPENPNLHRLMDKKGNIHFIHTDNIFIYE